MTPLPTIKATFKLDDDGHPGAILDGDRKHYRIRLQVDNAPNDTYAVTYLLHPTYYDPVRESRDRSEGFAEDLTSYGDFTVHAKIRSREGVMTVSAPLSTALETGYGAQLTPAIAAALDDIRAQ